MRKITALRRAWVGFEQKAVLLSAVLVGATLVANTAPHPPAVGSDPADMDLESLVLPAAGTPFEKTANPALATTTAMLSDVFQQLGYSLDAVRQHGQVPRVFLATLPTDLPALSDSDQRKLVFIKMVLPLVLHVNEVIAQDRERISALRRQFARTKTLTAEDGDWLRMMARSYGLGDDADFDELLRRVDVVPPSLAVAQAAIESGWGTSRFAHQGNALFGQYAFKEGEPGLIPLDRESGKTHRIKSFVSLVDAVKSYVTNLNTHQAYEGFRKGRAQMRAKDIDPDGYDLAETLTSYSELRMSYVKALRRLIDTNRLSRFDEVRLSSRLAL